MQSGSASMSLRSTAACWSGLSALRPKWATTVGAAVPGADYWSTIGFVPQRDFALTLLANSESG
jgi:hypothetical protein